MAYAACLENELKNEHDLVDSVMFHAELQTKLNSKQKKGNNDDPTMDVGDVCWLTGPRGQEFRQVAQEGRATKKQKTDDADAKKAEVDSQRQAC